MTLGHAAEVRPNGRPYHPRKPVFAEVLNDWRGDAAEIGVFRTHDEPRARVLAQQLAGREQYELSAREPRAAWLRLAMRDGELSWVEDDVRGMPALIFNIE